MRRMYSDPELLELDCMLPKYVNSSLLDPKTELGSFFIHCCESGAEAFLLVNRQSDVVSMVNVRESELANLDDDFTTDAIHNIAHRSAKQGGSLTSYTGGRPEWLGEAAC